MNSFELSELKTAQDERMRREKELLIIFRPFRKQFITTLEDITKKSVSKGIRGVKPVKIPRSKEEGIRANLTLNTSELFIVSIDDVHYLLDNNSSLAAKIFIYTSLKNDEHNIPIYDITVHEAIGIDYKVTYKYYFRFFTTSGPRYRISPTYITDDAGEIIAKELISICYIFTNSWAEQPPLIAMLSNSDRDRTIGFKES